jgi:hypothetical protein
MMKSGPGCVTITLWSITMDSGSIRMFKPSLLAACILFGLIRPASSDETSLVARLADPTNILVSITRHELLQHIIVPPSAIDTMDDRNVILRSLFQRVAPGDTDEQKIEHWVIYLQDRIAHPAWPPMHSASVMVTDPIWILQHRLGQCGQTNRVLVDGLLAAGYRARLVQLAAHVAAEAWWDGQWHYLDADWLKLGQFVRKPDGTIPSTAEIYSHPEYLKSVKAGREFELYPVNVRHTHQRYSAMFTHVTLGGYTTPYYLVKTATTAQEHDASFGWNYYRVVIK